MVLVASLNLIPVISDGGTESIAISCLTNCVKVLSLIKRISSSTRVSGALLDMTKVLKSRYICKPRVKL